MAMDWRKSVCLKRRPRSSTRMFLGSTPAARYSSLRRYALIDPPKPEPTMHTSTRSLAIALRQAPVARALRRQLAPVAGVAVTVRRGARVAHHAVARRVSARARGVLGGCAERGEGHRCGGLPQRAARVVEAEAAHHGGDPLVVVEREERAAVLQRAPVQVG